MVDEGLQDQSFPSRNGHKAPRKLAAGDWRRSRRWTPFLLQTRPLAHAPIHLNIVLATGDAAIARTTRRRPGQLPQHRPVQAEQRLAGLALIVLAHALVADPADQRFHFLLEGSTLLRGRHRLSGQLPLPHDIEQGLGPREDGLESRRTLLAHEVIGGAGTTAQVNPRQFTTGMVEVAVERGATLATGVVDGLAFAGPDGAVSGVSIDGVEHPADVVVMALGPWTSQAQRWMALPQVFGTKSASIVLGAEVPPQAVFSEFVSRDRQRMTLEMYPRPGGLVYVSGHPEHGSLPDDPDEIAPGDAACEELHRMAGVHASSLRDAEVVSRSACYRPLTVDGVPLIGPVPGAPGAFLATGHASWGILNAPATGRMVSEMILDGAAPSADPAPFALTRLPAGRI